MVMINALLFTFAFLQQAVAKAGFEAIRVVSEVHPQHAEYNDVVATAALAIAKGISEGSDEQIRCFVENGCIEKLCGLLKHPDPKIVVCCLEGLRNILKVGVVDQRAGKNGGKNIYRGKIAECGGLDSIESLTDHDNPEDTAWFEAFKKALVIICTYFPFDEYCIPNEEITEWSYYAIESPSAYQSNPVEGFQRPVIRFTVS
ncbi:hypothetical protein RHMOL_Rhmol10G0284300 [Rhododendron molle]|uniref:Uncharacterized protein n=1 Tax=Rhododendron molle TaxID=49168 RepID=A0ACC0M7P7_RHOML|nr:hypothetical protein RHMOL_Rhmol10G0284300 [Rhododendron molle]